MSSAKLTHVKKKKKGYRNKVEWCGVVGITWTIMLVDYIEFCMFRHFH